MKSKKLFKIIAACILLAVMILLIFTRLFDIQSPDENIDYRRVRNLQVYFKNNTKSLTTDLSEIEEWQGGDIVSFKKHIGIVSDRRDKNGVPYIIHHGSKYQRAYEQKYLKSKSDEIVGHYRWELESKN